MKTKVKKQKGKKSSKDTNFKVLAKPLTEQQIKEFVAYHKQHGNFPGLKIPYLCHKGIIS